jgi:HEPN domain-containing protein
MAKAPIDPFQIYLHAYKFLWSDEHLRRTGDDTQVMAFIGPPAIVLSSFTSELLLKCILVLEIGDAPNTHDLNALFQKLSPPTQQKIVDRWDKAVVAHENQMTYNEKLSGQAIPRDLPSALILCGKAFERMRYIYEDPLSVSFYIIDLPRILITTVWEIRPDWKNKRPAPAKLV